jgi:hypothetical protein
MNLLLSSLPWLLILAVWIFGRGVTGDLIERIVPRQHGPWRRRGRGSRGRPWGLHRAAPAGGRLLGLGPGVRGPPQSVTTQ